MDGVMTPPSPPGAAVQLSLKIPACGFVHERRFVCQEMMGWAGLGGHVMALRVPLI